MLRTIGKNIYLTRGDTAFLSIELFYYGSDCEKKKFELLDGDEIYLTVKNSFDVEEFLFQKKITYEEVNEIGEVSFKIVPSDTNNLQFKKYIYDVEIKTFDGDVYTIIPPSIFEIMPEVTTHLDEVTNYGQ